MTEIITFPMAPREAVRAAAKLAQWPAIPQFSTMIGDPSAAAGAVLAYGEAWKYYSDGAMHRNDLPLADDLVLQSQIRKSSFVVAFLGSGLVAPSPP